MGRTLHRHVAAVGLATGLVATLAVIWACASSAPPPQPPPVATGDVVGLRVFVDPGVPLTSTDSDCRPVIDSAPPSIVSNVQEALSKAGFILIADASAPHDVVLKLRGELSSCGNGNPRPWSAGGTMATGTLFASLEGNGTILGQVSASASWEDRSWGNRAIVSGLIGSPALGPWAASHKGAPAAAPVAVAPVAAAAPAAAPAAGGCLKDTDCKGDRVCERGSCVSPR